MPTLLSYGLGVDSTAILLHWLENPASRRYLVRRIVDAEARPPKFKIVGEGEIDLRDLTVITAMTGDEFPDLKQLVERHILPRLRQHGIRYVQVARASMTEKLSVLDDTKAPYTLHLDGDFKLSDESLLTATVPQYRPGARRCSLKYKGDPLDAWIGGFVGRQPFVQAIGFDANEHKRVVTDLSYSRDKWAGGQKTSIYPLFDWMWDRAVCQDFIRGVTGEEWPKSACSYCPFTMGEDPVMTRFARFPEAASKSLLMEYVSMALNHRQSIYPRGQTLLAVVQAMGQHQALAHFDQTLSSLPWAIYWVRRIYRESNQAYRSVRIVREGSRAQMTGLLPSYGKISMEGGIPRVITVARVPDRYPVLEELYVAAPRTVENKDRFPNYDERWEYALKGKWAKAFPPRADEEEEVEAEHTMRGQRPDEIPAVTEDDGREAEEAWLCDMSDILHTPYMPECPTGE